MLARRLRDLRAATFPSGSALARRLQADYPDVRWHQTRLSKLERGEQRPTEQDIRQWATATGATKDQTDELFALLAAARVEYATFGQLYHRRGGPVADQEATAGQEAASTRIAEFQPAMVPGLVQTAAYAREVLSLPCGPASSGVSAVEIEQIVGKRLDRQHVLYQADKKIELVMCEAALHTRFGSVETLVGQLDRLAAVTGLASVEISVIPFGTPLPVYPLTNFVIYDDYVLIESITAQHRIEGADEVALYERFFAQLLDAAVTGAAAATLIRSAMARQ